MSISITNKSDIFNNKNLIIIFNAIATQSKIIEKENYVFIYDEDKLIGINIFDYKKDFNNIESGFHILSNDNFSKLLTKFPAEMVNLKKENLFKIGLVTKINSHPKSQKLNILQVEIINQKIITIITNLNSVVVGEKYLFALKGAFLATGIIIDESKVMGIKSDGMICSYKSIGINKEGIVKIANQEILEEYIF